jgi:hypothetical protein
MRIKKVYEVKVCGDGAIYTDSELYRQIHDSGVAAEVKMLIVINPRLAEGGERYIESARGPPDDNFGR